MSRTWVLLVALAIACGDTKEERATPESEAKHAEQAAAQAHKDADAARAVVEGLQKESEALTLRRNAAIDALANAQSDADRASAKAALGALQKELTELEARMAEARAKAARAERMRGVKISKECLDNPLAKGCQ